MKIKMVRHLTGKVFTARSLLLWKRSGVELRNAKMAGKRNGRPARNLHHDGVNSDRRLAHIEKYGARCRQPSPAKSENPFQNN